MNPEFVNSLHPELHPVFEKLTDLSYRIQAASSRITTDADFIEANRTPQDGAISKFTKLDDPTAAYQPIPTHWMSASLPQIIPLKKNNELSANLSSIFAYDNPHAKLRVEDAVLPQPPYQGIDDMPLPQNLNYWDGLQAAANDSCAFFEAENAKLRWKQWVLNEENAHLVVAVFWCVVAIVFKPDHGSAPALQAHAFSTFTNVYLKVVLKKEGVVRDAYQQAWMSCIAEAACVLLRMCFPKSAYKIDQHFHAFVHHSLRHWLTGTLPSDLHSSHLIEDHEHQAMGVGFRTTKTSPVMTAKLNSTGLQPKSLSAGMMRETCGQTLHKYHRPLLTGVTEPPASYKALADQQCVDVDRIVQRYHTSQHERAVTSAYERRQSVAAVAKLSLHAKSLVKDKAAAKAHSDAVSGWLAQQQAKPGPHSTSKTTHSSSAHKYGPWLDLHMTSEKIKNVLSNARKDSRDLAARMHRNGVLGDRLGQLSRDS